eukprot:TRINITY_DN15004_c0_g1_i1.p1 TRINITY_DN15004_c0_g1~~TRINITY_DN15004_c0_g1_i1.p1  ORF type:complete len:575 (-),score=125.41 TRINITY_DN15004_c0_g1_i1:169-1821(-)
MAAAEGAEECQIDLLTEKDLYKILGVPRGAKNDDMKKAYKKRALKYHPDKNQDDPNAKQIFQKIAEAFSVLSDPKKRQKYDKSGDMDLEDFDIDQFMNMWVGEMMEDGGMVDEMMQGVLPWTSEEDKLRQFVEEKTSRQGGKVFCKICKTTTSNNRLMGVHFEKKHKDDCEEWAQETVKGMKASFESFMKQITGIGDSTGQFVMPDGTKADMKNVKGVPNIREHMEKRLDKAKDAEAVLNMYRKLDADGSTYVPTVKEIETALKVPGDVASELQANKEALLERLRIRIDEINTEEDQEDILGSMDFDGGDFGGLQGFGGLEGFGGLGGKGFGKGKGDMGPLGDLAGLESLIGSDPAALSAMLESMGGMDGLAGLGGDMGGLGGGFGGGFGGGPCGGFRGRSSGVARASQGPPADTGPSQDIGCKCGYSCGTMKALERHLERFKGDGAHGAQVTERPPSPPRPPPREDGLFPPGVAEEFGELPPGIAERLGLARGSVGNGYPARPFGSFASGGVGGADVGLECSCGFSAGTTRAFTRHMERFAGNPAHSPV